LDAAGLATGMPKGKSRNMKGAEGRQRNCSKELHHAKPKNVSIYQLPQSGSPHALVFFCFTQYSVMGAIVRRMEETQRSSLVRMYRI